MDHDVRIYEVSMRDGLQNEPATVPTATKLAHLDNLLAAGFRDIEVTAFVRPSWVPPLADAMDVVRALPEAEGVRYWALVPNERGLERALETGLKHVATFVSASESHNKANVNRTVRESMVGLGKVIDTATKEGLQVRSYVSTVFGCPFEGHVAPEASLAIAQELLAAGASQVALSDTIGSGNPTQVKDIIALMTGNGIALDQMAVHFHDTQGTALVNAYSAWQEGIRTFDGSIAGIGGCPYAPGAAGNAATEDLVNMFEEMGVHTGVDLERAADAAAYMTDVLGKELPGRFHRYLLAARARKASRSA